MRNSILPLRVTSIAMQKGATTILDLLFITFQTFLPSEPSARVDDLATIEAPMREKRRRGQGHHISASSEEADAVSKAKAKGKQKSKEGGKKQESQAKGKGKGGDSSKPFCTDYLPDNGCPRAVVRTGYQLSTCRRPRRDAKPKPEAKAQAKGQARPCGMMFVSSSSALPTESTHCFRLGLFIICV